ncbi:MAG TPA: hypothetical protein PKC30_04255 [Saprospiraceae bacterium]|nr:hypothetical protein [Saprospiraceae bacterium]
MKTMNELLYWKLYHCKIHWLGVYFIIIMLSGKSCSRKSSEIWIHNESSLALSGQFTEDDFRTGFIPCFQVNEYIPDPSREYLVRPRKIRTVYHIMNSEDSLYNFSERDAPGFLWMMEQDAIRYLRENEKMNLPEGNNTPVLPAAISYARVDGNHYRNGYFFHHDDELYFFINKGLHRNNHRLEVIRKYNVGGDSILNIFIMPHHPDSIISTSYHAHSAGIALGNNVKLAGIYENGGQPWMYATLFNHEVGHVLGLRHSWIHNDGCEDTPPHANCFQQSPDPPCNGIISNNMMDYNNSQKAITPCQLGIIHRALNDVNSRQRSFLVKDWCDADTTFNIIISGTEEWKGNKDIVHNIVIEEGGSLTLHCRLAMARDTRIVVKSGGSLILKGARLHNDCGETWKGIQLQTKGKLSGSLKYDSQSKLENVRLKAED